MDFEKILARETSLDPADWPSMRRLGHRMVDEMFDFMENIREKPAWQPVPEPVREAMKAPLPVAPQAAEAVYSDFLQQVFPYPKGAAHPRFWAFVEGNGTPMGALADFLAATMNSNVAIGEHSASYVDLQVIDWCKAMLGFPSDSSGMLVSGGSIANITGILVARNSFSTEKIRSKGLKAASGQLVMYTSTETHSCLQKAAEIAGIGAEFMRKVPVDADFRMKMDDLRRLVAEDRAAGLLPFCVVGTAGTVNTGAVDPLDEMLDFCRAEGLWLHIDGAFGAIAKLAPEFSQTLKAIEQADSVAFDLHKWLYVNYEVGCVLFRDAAKHRAAFAMQPSYLLSHERGLASGPDPSTNYGIELSRGFKSLKCWMSFKLYGVETFSRLVEQNIAQARFLGQLVENQPELELLAPVTMNICCFRFRPAGRDLATEQLNFLNKETLMRLHESGAAVPSFTMIHGRYAIRAAICNHRSRREDFELLVEKVLEIGRGVMTEFF